MKLCLAAVCSVLALALAAPAGLASNKSGDTKVVCLDETTLKKEYKERPRHCIFHKRHSPRAEAFLVRTKRDHWSVWGNNKAKGKGRAIASMVGATPVRIRLFDPVQRCGHTAFSKGHFFFPKFGSGSTVKLDTCA
jgi:hypothetical protein